MHAPKDELDRDSTLLVNSTSANSINLGDICNIMSMHDKVKATFNKNQAAFSK